jgi:hypothetical protein
MANISDHEGVSGKISFDSNRNPKKPVMIVKVDGPVNRFVTAIQVNDLEPFVEKVPTPEIANEATSPPLEEEQMAKSNDPTEDSPSSKNSQADESL